MFNLTKTNLKLKNMVIRTEKHGDLDTPACSLKMSVVINNTVMNQFHPDLVQSFYTRNDKKPRLVEDDMFPDLLFEKLKPIKWEEDFPGYRVIIVDELNEHNAKFIMSDCTLKKFEFEMNPGASVTVTFSINCDPSAEAVGWLYEMQKANILMTIEPPSEAELAKLREEQAA